MAKSISVYRIDYELKDRETIWTAFIAGYSTEEVVKYLAKIVGKKEPIKINNIGMESRLDAITDELRVEVVKGSMKKTVKQKVKEIKETEDIKKKAEKEKQKIKEEKKKKKAENLNIVKKAEEEKIENFKKLEPTKEEVENIIKEVEKEEKLEKKEPKKEVEPEKRKITLKK